MADQLADLPPHKIAISNFLYIPTVRNDTWQVKWQNFPPGKWQFEIHTDRLLLGTQADQVTDQLADLPPIK